MYSDRVHTFSTYVLLLRNKLIITTVILQKIALCSVLHTSIYIYIYSM
jgi:hypothetical protein